MNHSVPESAGHVPSDSYHESGTVEAWNERYLTRGMVWGTEPNQFLAAFAAGLTPCRVLDLGCGQGRNSVWLAGKNHQVTGLDLSPVAIEQARQLAKDHQVKVDFDTVDLVREWNPPPEAFDLIILSYLQLPPEDRQLVHRKAVEALAPGGTIWLIAHHSDNISMGVGGPPYPEVLFNENRLAADFSGLEIRRNEKVFRQVETENGETKAAHDVCLEARKPL